MSGTPEIKIKKLFKDATVPERAHPTDSGLDLFVYKFERHYSVNLSAYHDTVETTILRPNDRVLVNTGISATVGSPGYEIQIRPRSGLALKNGLTVLNTPGTIDSSYRGMIGVIVINLSAEDQTITKGMKIAQMVVCPVILSKVKVVEDLDETDRSAGGFGSTGV
jgi:dUTP pyrophosphatase